MLITHYGCAYYRELLGQPPEHCLGGQMEDLRAVKSTLHIWFPDMQVDAYVAMQHGRSLSFHEMGS